jgi:hypothetical protein
MATNPVIAQFPDVRVARSLLRTPWNAVDTQSGVIGHESRLYSGAYSASAFRIRTDADVLVYGSSWDEPGFERFGLRFGLAADPRCSIHLQKSRPSFHRVMRWPSGLSVPESFFFSGPMSATLGFGPTTGRATESPTEHAVPILWCCFERDDGKVLLYADPEIPLNVGIATMEPAVTAVKAALTARSVVTL